MGEYRMGEYRMGEYRMGEYRVGEYRVGEYRVGEYRVGEYRMEEHRMEEHRMAEVRARRVGGAGEAAGCEGPPARAAGSRPGSGALLLEAVAEVALLCGAVALRHFRSALVVETKADGSPVTVADREAERAAREWIEWRFPGDGILGEELGVSRPHARRCWVLDPIDGTKSFVRGVPLFGSLVAVVEGERVLAGAASFPALSELICAAPGEGCWWNGSRARVSGTGRVAGAMVLTTDERFPHDAAQRDAWCRLAARAAASRSWGDCYGYLLVATGRAEVMVDGVLSAWDAAALQPVIEEAGGVFTDWAGARTAFGGSAIATNAGVAEEARSLLGAGAVRNMGEPQQEAPRGAGAAAPEGEARAVAARVRRTSHERGSPRG